MGRFLNFDVPNADVLANRSVCKECIKRRVAEWRQSNSEAHREHTRLYRQRMKLRTVLKEAVLLRLAEQDLERFGQIVREVEDSMGLEPGTFEAL